MVRLSQVSERAADIADLRHRGYRRILIKHCQAAASKTKELVGVPGKCSLRGIANL